MAIPAATPASTALPPASRISSPACAARWCPVTTACRVPVTVGRSAQGLPSTGRLLRLGAGGLDGFRPALDVHAQEPLQLFGARSLDDRAVRDQFFLDLGIPENAHRFRIQALDH